MSCLCSLSCRGSTRSGGFDDEQPVEFAHPENLLQPSPGIRRGAVPAVHQLVKVSRGQPALARRFVPGHAQPAGQLHPASRLSSTLGLGGRLRFVSSVPSPGIAGRTGRGTHCFRPGHRGRGRGALRPLLPAHVCGLFCCPERAGRQPGTGLSPGPPTVSTQRVGPHPAVSGADGSSAAQPLIPATGPPECLCGTSGSARPDRPR